MSVEATPGNGRVVRHAISTTPPAVSSLRAAREAGEPDVVAFRRYAKRVREDLARSAESRVRDAR